MTCLSTLLYSISYHRSSTVVDDVFNTNLIIFEPDEKLPEHVTVHLFDLINLSTPGHVRELSRVIRWTEKLKLS